MVERTIDVASGDPGTPSLSGVVTWSVCPTVYKVYRCVYITLRPRERRARAWLPRMIYCAIWGLVHDLAVPPWPCQWCRPSTEIVTQRRTLYQTHTLFSIFLNQGLQSSTWTALLHSRGLLLQVCEHWRRHGQKPLLTDVPQPRTCFYSTWGGVGSRPGAFSEPPVMNLTRLKHHPTMSWNFPHHVTFQNCFLFVFLGGGGGGSWAITRTATHLNVSTLTVQNIALILLWRLTRWIQGML